jgi:sialic acid synthase SpsE
MIKTLKNEFNCPVGYSGHEMELQPTVAAVALGACFIERHITLDRTMLGSDHFFSLEPNQLSDLVHDIRFIEKAMGDWIKYVDFFNPYY